MKHLLFAMAFVAAVAHNALAGTIYDESLHGDLSLSTALTLGAGTNTVIGSSGHFQPNTFESDPFEFIVPVGYQLDRIDIVYTDITYLGPSISGSLTLTNYIVQPSVWTSSGSFATFADNCGDYGICTLISNGSPVAGTVTATFLSSLPLSAGTYRFNIGSGSAFASVTNTYNLDVSAVPAQNVSDSAIPAWLLVGFAGLIGFKRRLAQRTH